MRKIFKIVTIGSIGFLLSNISLGQEQQVGKWTLEQCVAYAIENNLTIERGRLDVQGSEINLQQSKANMLPNANANGSYGLNWGRSIDPTTNDFVTNKIGSASASASSNVLLFNWFRLRNSIKQANLDLEASKYSLEKSTNDVIFNVITFYTNVVFNQELLENATFQLNSTRQQLERTRKQVEVGVLPRNNLLDMLSQEATDELNLVNAENNLEFAMLQLKQILQIPADQPFDIEIPQIDLEENPLIELTEQQVYEQALNTMPEIKAADLSVESSRMGIDVAKAGLYPSISAGAGIRTNFSDLFTERFIPDGTFTTIDNPNPIGFVQSTREPVIEELMIPNGSLTNFGFLKQFEENRSTNIGVSINIPIFNRLQGRSNVQRSIIANKQAEIFAQEARNTLRQTIETVYNNVVAASKAYAQSVKQVDALEESFRMTEQRYNLQAVSFIDFQIANNNLFRARSDLLRAKYDYIFKQKVLDFYLGKPISFD